LQSKSGIVFSDPLNEESLEFRVPGDELPELSNLRVVAECSEVTYAS